MASTTLVRSALLEQLLSEAPQGKTIVTGGHFMVKNRHSLNDGTVNSFREAVEAYKLLEENGVPAALGVYINDIGLTCSGGDSCSLAQVRELQGLTLPPEYEDILRENGLDAGEVVVISERFIRNRAKRIFHHIRKNSNAFVEKENGYYFVPPDRPEIILTRKNDYDKYGTPACPLIMSAYGLELKRMGFENSINYYYVGSDNLENIPSYLPIEKGRYLARLIDPELVTENVYLG